MKLRKPHLPEITAVERLHLEPGDRLVVKLPDGTNREQAAQIAQAVVQIVGPVPLLLLVDGIELSVLSQTEKHDGFDSDHGGLYL